MRDYLFVILLFVATTGGAQVVTTDPVFPRADQPVTISVNVAGTSLAGYAWNNATSPVWIWAWIENGSNDIDAPTNINPATAAQDAAKCTRISTNPDIYQITITPTTFFNRPAAEIKQMGLKLKTKNWSDNKQTDNDRFITFGSGFEVSFSKPKDKIIFTDPAAQFDIQFDASETAAITLKVNGAEVASSSPSAGLSYSHTVTESAGTAVTVTGEADNGKEKKTASFTYIVRSPVEEVERPSGTIDGINYHSEDHTKVTLGLWAPGKTSVYVRGDFNNWTVHPDYQMKKDGEHFWLTIAGLTPGEEYAYQYLVDEVLYIADPYADKILDPDDKYIPSTSYPGLKQYPQKALNEKWYFNRVAVLQTGQEKYEWQVENFHKPPREELVIYELLIRDFFGSDDRTFQNLSDTIDYFKRLGVNAIELMPVMEFNGNESWGYNPAFMFAPDKYYGTKNALKAFIDRCHQEGIAVILDIAMNHHDVPNPYVMMDFDFTAFKPTASNKWFNVEAKHPFNVFFDMNHESSYTQAYLDTVNHYWLHEYRVDGFRFDLSKGFTQTSNPENVNAWSSYDASRVALLKRMAGKIWEHSPDAYIILEHFAANTEEEELAEYRANEEKGMMIWGNLTHAYNQNTMGYASESDVSSVYHGTRGWTVPHVVGYMESHDEERLMYKNLAFGNSSGNYSAKDLKTALTRVKGASVLFYTIPGPKMLWQFGELGYDQSINRCGDGSISDNCRVSPKPVKWEYVDETARASLFSLTSDLIRLRMAYDVFTSGEATFQGNNTLIKQVTLKNKPYTSTPADTDDMNAKVVINFELTKQNVPVEFPHTGTWYDYYAHGESAQVNATVVTISLEPGEYKIYTDVMIDNLLVTGTGETQQDGFHLFPNPVNHILEIHTGEPADDIRLFTLQGTPVYPKRISLYRWDVQSLAPGLYVVSIRTQRRAYWARMIKN